MKRLILDLDTGIDDALALAYALGSPELELIGVIGSFGNVRVEEAVRNTRVLLALLGHPEVPVVPGADRALMATAPFEPSAAVRRIHGSDGLGECGARIAEMVGASWPAGSCEAAAVPTAGTSPKSCSPATAFLLEAARTYGEDLLYVPTGPLTNLARALREAPELENLLGTVTLMGGALTVPGNVSPCAEANVANDPEAANEVLCSEVQTIMVGLDVTHQTLLTKRETASWRAMGTPASVLFADMTDHYIDIYAENNPYLAGCSLHDPLAVAVALEPDLVTALPINLAVDLEGAFRGRTVGDDARLNDPYKTSEAAIGVDAPRFLSCFMERVGRALGNAVTSGTLRSGESRSDAIQVFAPTAGRVAPLAEVPDPVFAGGILGPGCAIWPKDDVVRAPMDGEVTACLPHAVGLRGASGMEILVHVGIDTVEMAGRGFCLRVAKGDRVREGDTLLGFDSEVILAAGHPNCVVVVVGEAPGYEDVELAVDSGAHVEPGDVLLFVR